LAMAAVQLLSTIIWGGGGADVAEGAASAVASEEAAATHAVGTSALHTRGGFDGGSPLLVVLVVGICTLLELMWTGFFAEERRENESEKAPREKKAKRQEREEEKKVDNK